MIQQFQISFNKFIQMAKKSNGSRLWFLGAFLLWLASYFVIRFIFKLEKGDAGTFGDQFGAINALFTGLSFAGIIITLRLQQEELSAQRREFMTNRATNQLYQQVVLINTAFNSLKYYDLFGNASVGQKFQPYDGIAAYNSIIFDLDKIINLEKDKNDIMPKIVGNTSQLLRITTNSVKLLKRIREIENMSDADAQLLYETFTYNIDSGIWEIAHKLNLIDKNGLDPKILKDYEYEVHKILEFKVEFTRLNNLVKGS